MSIARRWEISRRRALGGATATVAAALSRSIATAGEGGAHHLIASPARVPLVGGARAKTSVLAYNGTIPGPTLRVRQGGSLSIVVENRLDQDTTIHWHGIRVPFAMDGVPGLTQPPIRPGERFTYVFTPPDAGTFWYHPHANSLEQLGRGLTGVLIVEEAQPVAVDRDLVWMLGDWRLTPDAQIAAGFGNAMEAGMSGRIGNTVTLNGTLPTDMAVRHGERVRLRLINSALARIMALRFEGHRPTIVALDGQHCDPHPPEDGRLLLGPAMRVDIVLDMIGEAGRRYAVVDEFYEGLEYRLLDLVYSSRPPLRRRPLGDAFRLSPNPLPEPDLSTAQRHELVLQGGMMSAAAPADGIWAINGMSMHGDGHAAMPPLLELALGRSHVLTMRNDTAWWHPMHLHGHSFRVLSRNGRPVAGREWRDTVLLAPKQSADVAFVADNPGDWMLHCHVIDHQAAGLMTVLRIA